MTNELTLLACRLLFAAPVAAILLGFFVFRPLKPEWTHWPILLSCALVIAASAGLAARITTGGSFDLNFVRWVALPDWALNFGLRIDGPCVAVLCMVALVGSLIHVYAAGYMKGDPGFSRFFLVFHLFFLAMIGLLTANNYVQLYLFWELVGVASYLLVGFWFNKESARKAALKAFLTNRVGDFGFLLALLLMLGTFHESRFQLIYLNVEARHNLDAMPLIGALLIWAACAKSAQFPLYFWLPDAMEGPTPTSALMHAATMVTAGVFLLIRSWPLIAAVPHLPDAVAGIGAFTAVAAAVIAGTKKDLKRILAYSTVSHLGLMMLALGLGRVGVAVFHLIVHGFFKAALFLCAGNVGHAIRQPTANVDQVGGWRSALPWTYACFVVAALSLAGVFPFGGFFSKDAILSAALERGGLFAYAGVLVSIGSAFYIFRMLLLTFHGDRPEQAGLSAHPHEAGPALVVPIALLSLGALFSGALRPIVESMVSGGWVHLPIGLPGVPGFFSLPGTPAIPAFEWKTSAIGTALVALGAGAAYYFTMIDAGWDWSWRASSPALERVFESDFGWKILVDRLVSGVVGLARFTGRVLDKTWWDGLIEGAGSAAGSAGDALSRAARGRLNDSLWWMAAGAALLLAGALR
jgi:NADH-quinone oxidoreductase subunit L